jgi:hypothetical protein
MNHLLNLRVLNSIIIRLEIDYITNDHCKVCRAIIYQSSQYLLNEWLQYMRILHARNIVVNKTDKYFAVNELIA